MNIKTKLLSAVFGVLMLFCGYAYAQMEPSPPSNTALVNFYNNFYDIPNGSGGYSFDFKGFDTAYKLSFNPADFALFSSQPFSVANGNTELVVTYIAGEVTGISTSNKIPSGFFPGEQSGLGINEASFVFPHSFFPDEEVFSSIAGDFAGSWGLVEDVDVGGGILQGKKGHNPLITGSGQGSSSSLELSTYVYGVSGYIDDGWYHYAVQIYGADEEGATVDSIIDFAINGGGPVFPTPEPHIYVLMGSLLAIAYVVGRKKAKA